MAQTIKLKRGTTTPTTSNIVSGEVAVDTSAQKLYINDGGTIKEVGGGGGGITYSVKTSAYTASAGDGIIADSSGGAFTITLPATPSAGDIVSIVDGAAWATNNVTVARNGSTIEGAAENLTLDVSGLALDLIYDGSTWQLYPLSGTTTTATESDTLDSVTGRGATTTNAVTVGNLTSTGIDDNATTTAITIDSDEKVLINRTTATLGGGTGSNLQIGSGLGDGYAGLTIHSTSTGIGDIQYADGITGDASYRGLIRYTHNGDYMSFWTSAAERMRIDSDGNIGIGTPTIQSGFSVRKGSTSVPAAGSADSCAQFGNSLDHKYGLQIGAIGSGKGYIQVQRSDGTATTYDLLVQPNGGNVAISGDTSFGKAIQEQQYNLTGTVIDPSNGTIQYKTLAANTTFTESLSDGEYVTLMIDDGAGYTITWPTTTWVGGSAPTLETTGYNVIELWHANGTLYGAFVGAA